MPKMFRKGETISTFEQLLQARVDGSGYIFWGERPLAIGFVENMSVMTVRLALRTGIISQAIRKTQHALLPRDG
jgi:hypothetical protein